MNLFELFATISLDTSGYESGVAKAVKGSDTMQNKIKVMAEKVKAAQENVEKLTKEFNESAAESGAASERTQELAKALEQAEKELEKSEKALDDYNDGLEDTSKNAVEAIEKTESFADKLKSGFSIAAKVGAGFATAIGGAVTALNGVAESTEESRIATGKLNTAFEAAGMSTQAAATAYNEFYKILGDTDTATEASQLLAQLAENEQDLTKWTRIAAGVSGTFGDSLPIESLIESANETAKVGQITGTLADALNWVGISEDEFNEKLAAASSEAERNQMIMETLSAQYETASESFYSTRTMKQ